MILDVVQLGQPVLRQKAREVNDFRDPKIKQLIDDLIKTLTEINGVGISAPQVGESIRLSIVASHPNPRYPHAPEMAPLPIINPEIIFYSEDQESDWEGCLSIPGIRAKVPRSANIKVKYKDVNGTVQMGEYQGFIARIFQHEIDHLNGLVFLDRLNSNKDIVTEKEYQRMVRDRQNQ